MKDPVGGTQRLIARLLRRNLQKGATVEIDGIGSFVPEPSGFRFVPQTKPRVFVAYVEEDMMHASRLYDSFEAAGFNPWLDKKKLLPGQNWPRSIETAIQASDFCVACFSHRSVSKRGNFHSELRFALESASRVPLDEIFLIPARIEKCMVPARITRHIQYVDLFPDWNHGFERILQTMREQGKKQKEKRLLLAG